MTTYEKQYQAHVDLKEKHGLTRLGVEKNGNWHEDPRRLLFVMSRYKFVSKMLDIIFIKFWNFNEFIDFKINNKLLKEISSDLGKLKKKYIFLYLV